MLIISEANAPKSEHTKLGKLKARSENGMGTKSNLMASREKENDIPIETFWMPIMILGLESRRFSIEFLGLGVVFGSLTRYP